jgi:hypothetical protein
VASVVWADTAKLPASNPTSIRTMIFDFMRFVFSKVKPNQTRPDIGRKSQMNTEN